jgi:hypothetical protein
VADDPYVIAPGTLPTPFSADDLRAGLPDGTVIVLDIDGPHGTIRQFNTFADCDDTGGTWSAFSDGAEPESARTTWLELQGHASFDAASATRVRETISHPLGELDCWRYDVGPRGDGSVFWFDLARPGMPVRMERHERGERVSGFEAIEWSVGLR